MCNVYVYMWIQMYVCMYGVTHTWHPNNSTLVQILGIHIVCGFLIEEVLLRDDGSVTGVSTLNDFGVVQSRVFHEVSIHKRNLCEHDKTQIYLTVFPSEILKTLNLNLDTDTHV